MTAHIKIESINPATEQKIETFNSQDMEKLTNFAEIGHHAFLEWRLIYLYTRAKYIKKIGLLLLERKEELAKIITMEMGKPIKQAIAEVEKCSALADYYAHNGPLILQDKSIKTEATTSFITYQPLGIILGIMPWNFPLWQVFRFVIPTILVGNGVILKHAPNVTKCALAIQKIFDDAGFPNGLFQSIFTNVDNTAQLIENKHICGVSLTGSERAGRAVGEIAGKNLKPCVLELGGSDPYIIFHDADLENAVESCVSSRLMNAGQTCISAKRFIVDKTIADQFTEQFIEAMKIKRMGDPMENNDLGPMARKDLRNNLHEQVEDSISEGAKLLLGGEIPDQKGFYYPPTILGNVSQGMPVWDEETFGPVAAITTFTTELEALRLAQDTPYGLGAALFSRDVERMEKLAKYKIMSGSVYINDFVKSDPRLPFGGIKNSGFGRELGEYGLYEFANIKSISIK